MPLRDPGPALLAHATNPLDRASAFVAGSREEPAIIARVSVVRSVGSRFAHRAPRPVPRARRARGGARHSGLADQHMADGLVPNRIPRRGRGRRLPYRRRHVVALRSSALYAEQAGSSIRSCAVSFSRRWSPPSRRPSGGRGTTFGSPKRGSLRRGIRFCANVDGRQDRRPGGDAAGWARRSSCRPCGRGRATRWRRWRRPWASASSRRAHAALTSGQCSRSAARFWCEKTGYPYDVVSETRRPAAGRDARFVPTPSSRSRSSLGSSMRERPSRCSPSPSASWSPPLACARWRRTRRATSAAMRGGVKERDRAYHEGTVWPFLLGFYVRAAIRHRPHDAAHREASIGLVRSAADNSSRWGRSPRSPTAIRRTAPAAASRKRGAWPSSCARWPGTLLEARGAAD